MSEDVLEKNRNKIETNGTNELCLGLHIASNDPNDPNDRCAEFSRIEVDSSYQMKKGVAYFGFWLEYGVTFLIFYGHLLN
jgi:hypothetical protein